MNPVKELEKFVWWLAGRNGSSTEVMMSPEDIAGDLFLEIAKGIDHYGKRYRVGDLTDGQFLAVLRRMCDNRIAELRHMHYGTHRSLGQDPVSISWLSDAEDEDDDDGRHHVEVDDMDLSDVFASVGRVIATRQRLSQSAKRVFDAVLMDNEPMRLQVQLAGLRASAVYKNGGTVKVRPHHVANALGMEMNVVQAAWREIGSVYSEVLEASND